MLKKKTLSNGLRIITVPMKDTPTVTVLVLVEAGSKYEIKNINGLSHFLEHMCFKGTPKRPTPIQISKELDGLGAQYNAFTSQEFTGYYAKAHAKKLSQIIDIISDMYLNPTFLEKEIQKEKGVIVEEIRMYEDMPQSHVQDIFTALLYGDQPAGWNVAGTEERVKAMTRDDFVGYRSKHYVAKGTTVIVAGKFDEKKIIFDLEKAFKSVSQDKKYDKIKVKESQSKPSVAIKDKETDQTHLVLGFRSYDIFDKKIPALKVLNAALGGSMSSRLFQKLREEMGLCYYVRSSTSEMTDHGYLAISAGVDKKRFIDAILAIIGECRKIAEMPIPSDELRKTKDFLIGNMYLQLESSDSQAEFYGFQEILKKEMRTPDQVAREIESVTSEAVQKIAKEIFRNNRMNLAAIGDIKEKETLNNKFTIKSKFSKQ